METGLTASVATFRVYSSSQKSGTNGNSSHLGPPSREERMATTQVTEGPLILSRLASNEITYLQVNSYTRAIMPRSRIWRVSKNELVIPGSFTNFWLITLSGSPNAIIRLDRVLKGLCRYEIATCDDGEDLSGAPFSSSSAEDQLGEEFGETSFVFPESPRNSGLVASARQTISQGSMSERLSGIHEYNSTTYHPALNRSPPRVSRQFPSSPRSQDISFPDEQEQPHDIKSLVSSRNDYTGPASEGALPEPKITPGPVSLATPPVSPPSQPSSSGRVSSSEPALDENPDHDLIISTIGQNAYKNEPLESISKFNLSSGALEHLDLESREEKKVEKGEIFEKEKDHVVEKAGTDLVIYPSSELEDPKADHSSIIEDGSSVSSDTIIEEVPVLQIARENELDKLNTDSDMGLTDEETIASSPPFPKSALTAMIKAQSPIDARFEPRFTHPLIPNSQIAWYHNHQGSANMQSRVPRFSLQRRELTTVGPGSLHQEVTTVGGYIGLKAVKGFLRKT